MVGFRRSSSINRPVDNTTQNQYAPPRRTVLGERPHPPSFAPDHTSRHQRRSSIASFFTSSFAPRTAPEPGNHTRNTYPEYPILRPDCPPRRSLQLDEVSYDHPYARRPSQIESGISGPYDPWAGNQEFPISQESSQSRYQYPIEEYPLWSKSPPSSNYLKPSPAGWSLRDLPPGEVDNLFGMEVWNSQGVISRSMFQSLSRFPVALQKLTVSISFHASISRDDILSTFSRPCATVKTLDIIVDTRPLQDMTRAITQICISLETLILRFPQTDTTPPKPWNHVSILNLWNAIFLQTHLSWKRLIVLDYPEGLPVKLEYAPSSLEHIRFVYTTKVLEWDHANCLAAELKGKAREFGKRGINCQADILTRVEPVGLARRRVEITGGHLSRDNYCHPNEGGKLI